MYADGGKIIRTRTPYVKPGMAVAVTTVIVHVRINLGERWNSVYFTGISWHEIKHMIWTITGYKSAIMWNVQTTFDRRSYKWYVIYFEYAVESLQEFAI